MPLHRQLEPEVMSEWDDAECYDLMDHEGVNRCFVDDLVAAGELGSDICDLGTGTALIPIEICQRVASVRVKAIDASVAMLELARYRLEVSSLTSRIQLRHARIDQLSMDDHFFDTIISNSLVHHLAQPLPFFQQCARLTKPGGLIFVRDLARPENDDEVERLVQTHTHSETLLAQQLFRQSLYAALSIDEVQMLVEQVGFPGADVAITSDRHWTWKARLPAQFA